MCPSASRRIARQATGECHESVRGSRPDRSRTHGWEFCASERNVSLGMLYPSVDAHGRGCPRTRRLVSDALDRWRARSTRPVRRCPRFESVFWTLNWGYLLDPNLGTLVRPASAKPDAGLRVMGPAYRVLCEAEAFTAAPI